MTGLGCFQESKIIRVLQSTKCCFFNDLSRKSRLSVTPHYITQGKLKWIKESHRCFKMWEGDNFYCMQYKYVTLTHLEAQYTVSIRKSFVPIVRCFEWQMMWFKIHLTVICYFINMTLFLAQYLQWLREQIRFRRS